MQSVVLIEILNLERLCKVVTEEMRCAALQCARVLHHTFDAGGHHCARKFFGIALDALNDRHRGVGGITESDASLAVVSNASIIGFNVRPDRKARELAEQENVEMRLYEVIYNVLEDVNNALVGMLKPEFEEVVTGEAEVREVFGIPRIGKVAGCFVTHGTITRGSKVRFLRDGTVIWKGAVASLRRFKDDVREVREGFECGVGLENYSDLKAGDIIETFEEREIARV